MARSTALTRSSEGTNTTLASNPYSFASFQSFLTENFSLIVIVILFFMGGFFFGSVWTEKNIYKSGSVPVAGGAGTGAAADAGPGAEQAGRDLSIPGLVAKAEALGVDSKAVESCINSGETAKRVSDDQSGGTTAGVSGTPSTFLVLDGKVVDSVPGALPYAQVKQMVDAALANTAPATKPEFASLPAVTDVDHFRGNKDARLVLVEYSDYECPFCQQFHPSMTQLMDEYGDKIGWVYRHYPLSFHPSAQKAAEAAECVTQLTDNETFWEYTDALFTN